MKRWIKIIGILSLIALAIIVLSFLLTSLLVMVGVDTSISGIDQARATWDSWKPVTFVIRLAIYALIVLRGYPMLMGMNKTATVSDARQAKLLLVVVCLAHEIIIVQRLFI